MCISKVLTEISFERIENLLHKHIKDMKKFPKNGLLGSSHHVGKYSVKPRRACPGDLKTHDVAQPGRVGAILVYLAASVYSMTLVYLAAPLNLAAPCLFDSSVYLSSLVYLISSFELLLRPSSST
jgi:hypothetical protein